MPRQPPEVSVVIPAHGVAPYIREALGSVLAQSGVAWEAIVINDGSPDTPALEAALEPFLGQIRYQVQPHRGAAAARNIGLRLARGKWLAFLDGDDAWEPEFLSRQLDFLARGALDMAWSDAWLVGDVRRPGTRLMTTAPCRGPVSAIALLTQTVNVITSATVVRRACVEAAGGFDESLLRGQDFDLWVRLLHRGTRADYIPEPLIRYRVRKGSLSGDQVDKAERAVTVVSGLQAKLQFSGKEAAVLEESIIRLRAHLALATGKYHLARGEYAQARSELTAASRRLSSPKLRLALALLYTMPGLLRRLYLARNPEARHL